MHLSPYVRSVAAAVLVTAGLSGTFLNPASVAAAATPSEPQSFTDSFEGSSINPWWSVTQQYGSVGLSAVKSHSGGHAARFTSRSGGQREMHLKHRFSSPTRGNVSVYFYDNAPGQETLYETLNLYNSAQPKFLAGIGTQDFDANCYSAVFDDPAGAVSGQNANCGVYPQISTTSVHRTLGWHLLSITVGTGSISFAIDGQQLFSTPGNYQFDTIDLAVAGPDWRPNTSAFFDDFTFQP
jgi:hypothetical protein